MAQHTEMRFWLLRLVLAGTEQMCRPGFHLICTAKQFLSVTDNDVTQANILHSHRPSGHP